MGPFGKISNCKGKRANGIQPGGDGCTYPGWKNLCKVWKEQDGTKKESHTSNIVIK